MSISVNTIAPPSSVIQQVVTTIANVDNEITTREVAFDPTDLLLVYRTINRSVGQISFYANSTANVIGASDTLVAVANTLYGLNSLSLILVHQIIRD